MKILKSEFYLRDTITVAKNLLGKILIHKIDNILVGGKIVETEAYLGINDKAAHVYGGRKTPRVMPMYGPPGNGYIYSIYGKYVCLNAITQEVGTPQGVLIRAVEPLIGLKYISRFRFDKEYNELTKKEILNLTSGPSKLCLALKITKEQNNKMLNDELMIIENDDDAKKLFEIKEDLEGKIVESKRIGIDYAEEAKDYLYRFYYKDNSFVSKKDK